MNRPPLRIESLRFGARDGFPFDPQDIPRTEAQQFDAWARLNGIVQIGGSAGTIQGIEFLCWDKGGAPRPQHDREIEALALIAAAMRLANYDAKIAAKKLEAWVESEDRD